MFFKTRIRLYINCIISCFRAVWDYDDRGRDIYAPMKPPPMMMWEEEPVEFKPATVVDYGHQASLATPAVAPAVKKDEFQEPVQTFDYGHGKPANSTAVRSVEREPGKYCILILLHLAYNYYYYVAMHF
jgi:hypothetical protein